LSWMVTAGESRGDIPGALSDAASFYDLKADSRLSRMFNVAPPVITIAIAIPVAIVSASIIAFLRWHLDVQLLAG
jgi:type II secretory pathway component PulF